MFKKGKLPNWEEPGCYAAWIQCDFSFVKAGLLLLMIV